MPCMWSCKKRSEKERNFIARAIDMHGDQYDYSLSENGKMSIDKVRIMCTRHDRHALFEQNPNKH
jgi:hypothetical protein